MFFKYNIWRLYFLNSYSSNWRYECSTYFSCCFTDPRKFKKSVLRNTISSLVQKRKKKQSTLLHSLLWRSKKMLKPLLQIYICMLWWRQNVNTFNINYCRAIKMCLYFVINNSFFFYEIILFIKHNAYWLCVYNESRCVF